MKELTTVAVGSPFAHAFVSPDAQRRHLKKRRARGVVARWSAYWGKVDQRCAERVSWGFPFQDVWNGSSDVEWVGFAGFGAWLR